MKSIVVYKSSKGVTKQYAQWIGSRLRAEVIDVKDISKVNLSEYDQVIFGGWVFGGHISGLDQVKKYRVERLVVYAVGLSPMSKENDEKLREVNQLGQIPFFYFPGAMKYSELGFIKKQMLKIVSRQTLKNPNATPEEIDMAEKMLSDFDASDIKYIEPLAAICQD